MADVMGSFARGFSLGDRVINTQRNREKQEADDAWQEKVRGRQESQWGLHDQDRERRLKKEESDLAWQEKSRGRQETVWGQQDKASEASLAASKSTKAVNDYNLARKTKSDWLNDNNVLLDAAFTKWGDTGVRDPILDNPNVIGGRFDPESFVGEKYDALINIEKSIPDLISGKVKLDDPEVIKSFGSIYQEEINGSVGQVDSATGKTIKSAKMSDIRNIADIDPNTPGNQAGFIISTEVTYDDGSTAIKPVTQSRSTDPNEAPLVIPAEAAIKDITGQLGIMRTAVKSDYYPKIFENKNKDKSKTEMSKEYTGKMADIGKAESKAMSDAMDPEDQARIKKIFNGERANLTKLYNPWISGGESKKKPTDTTDPKAFASNMQTLRIMREGRTIPDSDWNEAAADFKSGELSFEGFQEFINTYDKADSSENADEIMASITGGGEIPQLEQDFSLSGLEQARAEFADPSTKAPRPDRPRQPVEIPSSTMANVNRIEQMGLDSRRNQG